MGVAAVSFPHLVLSVSLGEFFGESDEIVA